VAVGAVTRRIMRQLLTESLLLSFLGGSLGLFLTPVLLKLIVSFSTTALPRVVSTEIDLGALLFTFVAAVGTGVLFGLAPALEAGHGASYEILKEGGRAGTDGRGSQRLHRRVRAREAHPADL